MVIVTNEPYAETEPMLLNGITSIDSPESKFRKKSYEEAYKNVASSMQADQLQIKDSGLACRLLSTAINLKNMPLVKQCIEILNFQLNKENVVSVYMHLAECKMPINDFEPSAPPIVDKEDQIDENWVEELIDNLRNKCLILIDKNADYIMKQDIMLQLPYNDMMLILTRDSLEVTDESLVYGLVMKWATQECFRRKLVPHMVNRIAVIRDLKYAPRYGLLTKKELRSRIIHAERGPTKSGILQEHEWRKIQFYIKEKRKRRQVDELPYKLSQPRIKSFGNAKFLSPQSSIGTADDLSIADKQKLKCTGDNNACENFLLNFLTCWAALFD